RGFGTKEVQRPRVRSAKQGRAGGLDRALDLREFFWLSSSLCGTLNHSIQIVWGVHYAVNPGSSTSVLRSPVAAELSATRRPGDGRPVAAAVASRRSASGH